MQCRLGLDCHMKYTPLTSWFSHTSKRATVLIDFHGQQLSAYHRYFVFHLPSRADLTTVLHMV